MSNLLFSFESLLHKNFSQTDLGELFLSIPFESFAQTIPAPAYAKSNLGRKPWFDVKGGIGLLILKHYTGLSDALLMERINTDWAMQLFCGILLKPGQQIKDINQPSFWRTYIGKYLDINAFQKRAADYWKPWMHKKGIGMQDATCYESRISFPTDIKLLWKCCNVTYLSLQQVRKQNKQRRSRMNYDKRKKDVLSYQRTKKKTRRAEKKLRIKLLKFLLKLLQQQEQLQKKYNPTLSLKQKKQLQTCITVYRQQHGKLYGDTTVIKDRIVSFSKPYIRPIVRGKEVKQVEFGAKVNVLQVDGINFIEYLSYNAFNEGIRLQEGIFLQRKLFGKCTHQSADKIYATNANRSYCKQNNIATNFIPKGRQKEQHIEQAAALSKQLNIQRGTVLEGSFGNEKNHYLLNKIAARNKTTETCWIFFGMLTANASKISKRMKQQSSAKSRAA